MCQPTRIQFRGFSWKRDTRFRASRAFQSKTPYPSPAPGQVIYRPATAAGEQLEPRAASSAPSSTEAGILIARPVRPSLRCAIEPSRQRLRTVSALTRRVLATSSTVRNAAALICSIRVLLQLTNRQETGKLLARVRHSRARCDRWRVPNGVAAQTSCDGRRARHVARSRCFRRWWPPRNKAALLTPDGFAIVPGAPDGPN